MSTSGQEFLRSFELLPDAEKREVALEILRRAFPPVAKLDDMQLAAIYSDLGDEERELAEEGIEGYRRGLLIEDAE